MKKIILAIAAMASCSLFIMCSTESNYKPIRIIKDDHASLKNVAPFNIGASVNVRLLKNDSTYKKILVREYNSITAENAMKWEAIHPQQNRYDFSDADHIVQFALANKMRIHGHNLAWYQALPKWLQDYKGDENEWNKLLKDHIYNVVGHYKGKITSWDVVNEAFDENGNYRNNDPWGKHIGKNYIIKAFEYAHQADTAAVLFYNDYGQDESEKKKDAIINLIKQLKSAGCPISGIGLQMHIKINSNEHAIQKMMKQYAATGLLIHISELDISINGEKGKNLVFTREFAQRQAAKYKFIVDTYRTEVPRKQQYGITTWDVGDKDSWLRKQYHHIDWPLLFDDEYKKKDCYYTFLQALKEKL